MDATDLAFAGAARQAALVRTGEIGSRELVEIYLDRIARHDPALNAYRVVHADAARAAADEADVRRAQARTPRPAERRPARGQGRHGRRGRARRRWRQRRPRRAGRRGRRGRPPAPHRRAVIIGKTHVPEVTIMPWTESPTSGVTRNPWDRTRTPGGSSGGVGGRRRRRACGRGAGLRRRRLDPDPGRLLRPVRPEGTERTRADGPAVEPWHGMSTWGPITRRVADSALFYDAVKNGGPSFADAAAQRAGQAANRGLGRDPAADGRSGRRRADRRGPRRRRRAARPRPRGDRARDRVPARTDHRHRAPYLRGIAHSARRARTPSACRAAPAAIDASAARPEQAGRACEGVCRRG